MSGYWVIVLPPYVNALATSLDSEVQNWMHAKATKSAKKIATAEAIIPIATTTFSGVQSTQVVASRKIADIRTTRASRRRAKSSAHTCASSGTGRTIMASSRPSRTMRPSRSTPPTAMSAVASPSPVAPYNSAISRKSKPPRESTAENMIQMPTKSRAPMATLLTAMIQKEVR